MAKIHLWQEETKIINNLVHVSTTIEMSNQSQVNLWYRFSLKYQEEINTTCDSFVIATILLAMSQGCDLIVHGQVSPSLLDNLDEFQDAWCCYPLQKYTKIMVQADTEKELEKPLGQPKAISAFSGGLDSCFTAFRHSKDVHRRKKYNLLAGLMVHGLDIPISQEDVFTRALKKSIIITNSLGIELIEMATNFRQVIKLDWEDVFNTTVASCLHFFSKGYTQGIIPASTYYTKMVLPSAFDPITDSFLSSKSLEIINDGSAFTRLQKTEKILNWQEITENLRVCWQGENKDQNCGKCEKCIRTILTFRALNYGLPCCFEKDVTDQQILNLKLRGLEIGVMESLINQIQARDKSLLSQSWVKALQKSIKRNRILEYIKKNTPLEIKNNLKKIKNAWKQKL
ncbi:MAG: hypothetical protein F6K23_31125 [Okeania sp. SIO2C9]|uniref:hypothetical protein n=1 Tax=Okeania sp. SIO2C9 TaxID=2607791 RepID=UPI0013C22374|nr:hypothetical protein [Okeania sp. SIO2C9]NEQ77073.1 hypothetical protein [Okeania sp. SIO2C9]